MIEILDESQPWEVPLPHTWEDHERLLEARGESAPTRTRKWRWTGDRWLAPDAPSWALGMSFSDIVKWCMERNWRLYSLPLAPGGVDGDGT